MIITGDTYVGRTAARTSSEWHTAFGGASLEDRRCHSYLACVLGNDSVLHFELLEADGHPGAAYDVIEVRQCLDLSAVSREAKVRICLRSRPFGNSQGGVGVLGFYPFGEYRFTIIRYGALRLRSGVNVADLLALDCAQLFDARGVSIASSSLMLLNVRGHGTSGSIQLVSRSLGERLLRFYPSIYSS
jgi:hypothetical protein